MHHDIYEFVNSFFSVLNLSQVRIDNVRHCMDGLSAAQPASQVERFTMNQVCSDIIA